MSTAFTYTLRPREDGFYVQLAEHDGTEENWHGPFPTAEAANEAVRAMLQSAAEDLIRQSLGLQ